jgi:hypothetical protein
MEKYKYIVKKGFQYALEEPLAYSQVELVEKFKVHGVDISTPTMSNLYKQKERVSIKTWKSAAQALQLLLKDECNLIYDENKKDFVLLDGNGLIQPKQDIKLNTLPFKKGISFHARGRLTIQEKVNFISSAKHRIIELGVGLRSFCSYFYNRSYFEFQQHVEKILERNVEFQCLLLDPTTNIAETYLQDRNELYLLEDIEKSIDKLEKLSKLFQDKELSGQFLVSTYNHIPYNHFCVIDPEKEYGKMIISPYIFGIKRADAPVYEINRTAHEHLFENYWKSLQYYQNNNGMYS